MRPNCCHISLAFVLKFLNFLQTFIGVSIILYSVWMLNHWNNHIPISPPSAPSPDSPLTLFLNSQTVRVSGDITPLNFAADFVSGFDDGFALHELKLPAPWFIYSFMGVGVLLCCVTFIGCIAAESINGHCLCFKYTLVKTVFILLEAALVVFIAVDRHWEKDLPFDTTGELESLRSFIAENIDICKWVGITVVTVQALSLLLAIILRALVSARRANVDYDNDYEAGTGTTWEPLVNPQSSGSIKGDVRGTHSDIWSSRIREKYGLNTGGNNLLNQSASMSSNSKQ